VATGGDEVSITDGKLFVNDKESSVQGDGMDADGMFSDSTWTLEDDEYFVLGDNLKNAEDSRYIGPIKANEVIAKFVFSF
jgi:signal peptidase I